MNIKDLRFEGVNWIQMIQDTAYWRTLVNTEMNTEFHETGNFLTS